LDIPLLTNDLNRSKIHISSSPIRCEVGRETLSQPINQPTNQSTKQAIDRPTYQSINQSVFYTFINRKKERRWYLTSVSGCGTVSKRFSHDLSITAS